MKAKRVLIIFLLLALCGATAAYANDAYDYFRGKKIKVTVNGQTLKTNGVLTVVDNESKVLLPVREIANQLHAIVKWDESTQTVSIIKPNVHIWLTVSNKDGSFGTFGIVDHGSKLDFNIFVQMDNIKSGIHGLRFEIVDPYNNVVYESEKAYDGKNGGIEWLQVPVSMEFKYLGSYRVKMYMKDDPKGEYYLLSEKVFNSVSK
jgi:hypothetical protein